MGSQPGQRQPKLGATFYPGGVDDFYMPEVISPSPQRITAEVPEKIQDNLAHLELDATSPSRSSGLQSPPLITDGAHGPMTPNFPSRNSSYTNTTVSNVSSQNQIQTYQTASQNRDQGGHDADAVDPPTFSPFPPLSKRPANVPPSDEEKEGILESARTPVLNSNNPEMQLSWAQDALAYVEIAVQNEMRLSENNGPRPQTPHIEHQLRTDAINIVSFLADQHHPKAEFMKGMWLEFGKFNIRRDKKEAFRCYQRAAQKGYARAEYRMGMQFESSNEPDKAIKHYNLGVQAGDSASNYRLGMMTLLGQHGQQLDYPRGIKLVNHAAQTADENAPQGAYVFGMLQAHELTQISLPEEYLTLNVSAAKFNIEKAAYLGFAKAQAKMGAAYELCQLGCDFDPALSLHYNALASKQGDPEADMAISKWFLCGYEGVFEKNEELAFVYAQRAAQNGLATAEFALGYFFEVGIFVRVNLKESRTWYQKAADHGNKDAVARIEGISRSKTLSRKDHENVAVAKIQSQYGSHRGKRPERFKTPSAPMPTIADSPVNMPEPKVPTPRPGENRPYAYRNTNGARPSSVAPYPLDDGRDHVPGRPMSGAANPNYNVRASVDNRPPSVAQSEESYPDGNYRGSSYPTFHPPKPNTALEGMSAGRGRGTAAYGASVSQATHGHRPPNQGYTSSHPPGSPSLNSRPQSAQPPSAQGYGAPRSGYSSPHPINSPTLNSRPPSAHPPAIDIGFSAPLDPSGADRRKRQQRPDNPNVAPMGTPRPLGNVSSPANQRPPGGMPPPAGLPRLSSYEGQAGRNSDRIGNLPHTQSMPPNNRVDNFQSLPTSAGRQGVTLQDGPPRPDSAAKLSSIPPRVQKFETTAPTPPPSVPVAKPPGKGPKTFQEMGVPPSKNESDCVIM